MHVKNAQQIILHAATSTPRRTHSHQHRREEASVEVALGQAQVFDKNIYVNQHIRCLLPFEKNIYVYEHIRCLLPIDKNIYVNEHIRSLADCPPVDCCLPSCTFEPTCTTGVCAVELPLNDIEIV